MAKSRFSLFDTKGNWFIGVIMLSVAVISLLLITNLVGSPTTRLGKAAGINFTYAPWGAPGTPAVEWDDAYSLLRLTGSKHYTSSAGGGFLYRIINGDLSTPVLAMQGSPIYTFPIVSGEGYIMVGYSKGDTNLGRVIKSFGDVSSITYSVDVAGEVGFGNAISLPVGVRSVLPRKYSVEDMCQAFNAQMSTGSVTKIAEIINGSVTGDTSTYPPTPEFLLTYHQCGSNINNFSINDSTAYFVYVSANTPTGTTFTLPN